MRSLAKLTATVLGLCALTLALALVLGKISASRSGFTALRSAGSGVTGAAPEDTLQALVAALGDRRPIEPRLVGGFPHAPCSSGTASREDLIPLARCSAMPAPGTGAFRQLIDAGKALRSQASSTGPLLHSRGVWHLVWLDDEEGVERAVHDLEKAATLSDPDTRAGAEALSDLAAAYLVRAAVEDQPLDLVLALDASGRAVEQAPDLPEALFNHALAIEALHLRTEAATAWEDVLGAEPTGPWAEEAREHLHHLEEPTVLEAWEVERPRLERAAREGDTEAVDRLVSAFGPPVRDWIEEELLPRWGEAVLSGQATEAEETLGVARAAADALARRVGEHMPADAVAAIDRADAAGRLGLAEAHRSFGEGMKRYREHDCTAATESFAAAEKGLAAGRSPFALRAILQQDICSYYGEPGRTRQILESTLSEIPRERFPTTAARVAWMIGLCHSSEGRPVAAISSFEAGIEELGRTGDPDAGTLYGYSANVEEELGRVRQSWNDRLLALAILAPHGDPRGLYHALQAIVESLLNEDRPDLAVHFQDELLVQARAWAEPGPLADAYLTRSRIRSAMDDARSAMSDFKEAEAAATRVPDGEIRNRLDADLTAQLGKALAATEPARAVQVLSRSIESYRAIGHVVRAPELLVSRARASLAVDDVDDAERDLVEAARAQEERLLDPTTDAGDRMGLFAHAQAAYDEMIAVRLDHRQDSLGALLWADRSRGREVEPSHWERRLLPPGSSDLLRMVPPGVTAVEYAVLPDRLVFWILGRELHTVVRRLPAAELGHQIEAVRTLIETRAPEEEIRSRSAPLFEALLRPVVEIASPGETLLLVPDRTLHRLPFAALWDARSHHYLVERFALAEAPSLALALSGRDAMPRPGAGDTVLAVGSSDFDRDRYPELPALPNAEAEARRVADLYPRPEVLVGEEATPASFAKLSTTVSVVHFAGHAVVDPGRPLRSALVLAPSKGDDGGGIITAERLSRLDLGHLDLVYLSACRTVTDLPVGGRGGLGGLTRAALVAGAAAVVANRWEIDDAAALAMAVAFHGRYARGGSPVAALSAAQRTMIADDRPSFSHPASWSGLALQIAAPSLLARAEPVHQTRRDS